MRVLVGMKTAEFQLHGGQSKVALITQQSDWLWAVWPEFGFHKRHEFFSSPPHP